MEQYVDDNIRDNISDVRMDELMQAILTDPGLLECLRLIEKKVGLKLIRSIGQS